uniref:Uncharacterized protein n=1 Tax=Cucumis melo TaxID=3656 RepID=A0A9I9D8Q8_CUCME
MGKILHGRDEEEINALYDLLNDLDVYPGQRLITDPREGDAKKITKPIAWPGADWTRTPIGRLQPSIS